MMTGIKEISIPTFDSERERLRRVVNESWALFRERFLMGRYGDLEGFLERNFQFHFADILKTIGELHCVKADEIFHVRLEETLRSGEHIDIVCYYEDSKKCGIELKFKTKTQSAEDLGCIGAYKDIKRLESFIDVSDQENQKSCFVCGHFFMITNHSLYLKKPSAGSVRDLFPIHQGSQTIPSYKYCCKDKKSVKPPVSITLRSEYKFQWEYSKTEKQDWYFLDIPIDSLR